MHIPSLNDVKDAAINQARAEALGKQQERQTAKQNPEEAKQTFVNPAQTEQSGNIAQTASQQVGEQRVASATQLEGQKQTSLRSAHEIYQAATPVQENLNTLLGEIRDELGLQTPYEAVSQKSLESMENKVARKKAEGREYSLMDMKDHARSRLIMDSFDQVDSVLNALDERGIPYQVEAVGPTDYGYQGIHVTWRTENGLGVEVQLTTPEAWKTKLVSDQIYDKWRNVDSSRLSLESLREMNEEIENSIKMWNQLDLPNLSMYSRAFSSETTNESMISAPKSGREIFPQRPSENSSYPTDAFARSSRPDSVTEYRNSFTGTPPSDSSSIQPTSETVKQGKSQFATKTGQNTTVLLDEVKQKLKDNPLYQKASQKASMDRAIQNIETQGYESRKTRMLDGATDILTPDGQVEAYVLSTIAKENGDAEGQAAIAFKVKESGTLLAQSLAMRQIYLDMSPEAKSVYVQRLVDQINNQYESRGKSIRVTMPDWVEQALLDAGDDQTQVAEVLDRAYREIAQQMPYSVKDALNTWRFLCMLGNPLTHVKNMAANAAFMPYVATKNRIAAGLEIGVSAWKKSTGREVSERTKTLGPLKKEYLPLR